MYHFGGDIDNREAVHVWGQGYMETSVSSAQYYCESKIVLQIVLFHFKG